MDERLSLSHLTLFFFCLVRGELSLYAAAAAEAAALWRAEPSRSGSGPAGKLH